VTERKRSKSPSGWADDDEREDRTMEFSVGELLARHGGGPKGTKKVPALTAVAGRALGKVFRIETDTVIIGRVDDAQVSIHDEGVSRKHARITIEGLKFLLEDLGSTNGTFVNGNRIPGPTLLKEGDDISIGGTTILRFAMRDEIEEQLQARLYDLATRDPLTQAFNRRHFEERLSAEWAWGARHDRPCAICSIDADHFKNVNDTHGHAAGDYVLSELANVVRTIVRKEDVFARMGGEEFVVLARGTTLDAALVFADRIRVAIEQHAFDYETKRLAITVSIGVATSTDPGVTSSNDLMARADAALYRAKREGRNRVALV
jgi:two-component system cell cycle response regulator